VAVDARERRIRRAALLRIGVAAALLAAAFAGARLAGLDPSVHRIERWGRDLGALGPIVYVPLGVLLNCLFVPFPAIAGAAGLIFGTAEGAVLSVLMVAASAAVQLLLGRRLAGERAEALLGERGRTAAEMIARRGFWTVLYVRLVPLVPFTSLNYACGLTRLRVRDMFTGTGLAVAPRTFAYAALGGNISNLGSTEARVALGVGAVMAIAGAVLARRQIRDERRRRRAEGSG
jgi:uncharacterized membrane protein YdjX (TVP38/TMEM64 family)